MNKDGLQQPAIKAYLDGITAVVPKSKQLLRLCWELGLGTLTLYSTNRMPPLKQRYKVQQSVAVIANYSCPAAAVVVGARHD